MKLDSVSYLLFLLLLSLIPKEFKRGQNLVGLVLFASVGFLMTFGPAETLYVLIVTLINCGFAEAIAKRPKIFGFAVVFNVMIIGFAKFQTENLVNIVGASFLGLQAIALHFEIAERRLSATGLLNSASYLACFPKLLAGPIERPIDFFEKFKNPQVNLPEAWFLIMLGVVKKTVLVDRVIFIVDGFFRNPSHYASTGVYPLICFLLAYVQIYLSLSAYTDIARGAALIFGLRFSANFNRPFLSKNFSEFWSRNHITLAEWFKDFVFFPLVGIFNFKGGTVAALFLTTLLCGLWHGFQSQFVIWGLLNAFLIVGGHLLVKRYKFKFGLGSILLTFIFASFLAVLIQTRSIGDFFSAIATMINSLQGPAASILQVSGLERFDFILLTFGLGLLSLSAFFDGEKLRQHRGVNLALAIALGIVWSLWKFKSQAIFTYLRF